MKVVIAMDSFKGSLTTMQAGNAVREGIFAVVPNAEVVVLPMADGGEGTLEAILSGLEGEKISVDVCGPSGRVVKADYGILSLAGCAVIEVAQAVGISLLKQEEKNPLNTTSYGLGEIILDAFNRGVREFIIGLGGSATSDAGLGMLSALGFRFLDESGHPVGMYGRDVGNVFSIDTSGVKIDIKECRFKLACDVRNPLNGENGAVVVFGPQKGATPEIVKELSRAIECFSEITAKTLNRDLSAQPGAGAAGGLGFALLAFLNAEMQLGIDLVMEVVDLETHVSGADIVVTGEGKLDHQTTMGKTPCGVAKIAKKHDALTVAFSGCIEGDVSALNECGIDAYFSIIKTPQTMQEAMDIDHAKENLKASAEQVFRLIRQCCG